MSVNNPLWQFSTRTYNIDGVSEILLLAQNLLSVDINMILYAAWLASINRSFSIKDLDDTEELVRLWRTEIVIPIRNVRKNIKILPGIESLYKTVKKIEIDVERKQLDILYDSYLNNSRLDLGKFKVDLLDNNLDTLKKIGLNDEQIIRRLRKLLASSMELAS